MGFKYLDGKRWADVTREERHFCMHLYNCIIGIGTSAFVSYLKNSYGCEVNADIEWELAFEVCFYRDLWQYRGKRGKPYSLKRTFDLALFSDQAIIVIEAKVQQGFDDEQISLFSKDREQIFKETGIQNVLIVGLCSSKHTPSRAAVQCFDNRILKWSDLAAYFGNDAELFRADDIYESSSFNSFGRNNESGYSTGIE